MRIQHYNDKATRGLFEIDMDNLKRLFPTTNPGLIGYLARRDYANSGDGRFELITIGGDQPAGCYCFNIRAVSKVRGDDVFSEEVGEAAVRRQLHRKAMKFATRFADALRREGEIMAAAVTGLKTEELTSFYDYSPEYHISPHTSAALVKIPKAAAVSRSSIAGVVNWICHSVWKRLYYRKRVTVAESRCIAVFIDELREKLMAAAVGTAKVERGHAVLCAKVTRYIGDGHSDEAAKRALDRKLSRAWWKLNVRIRKAAVAIIMENCSHPEWMRWKGAIERSERACEGLGL